jgi:hypothetical protein
MAKARKKTDAGARKESSSAFFERIRPKFLDWVPPSQEELRLEAQKRRDDRDAELKKVTALEKAKLAEKKSGKKKLPQS